MNVTLIFLLIAGHFVTDINNGGIPAFLPFIKENLGLSYTMTASVILIFNLTSSLVQPVFGFISDRLTNRWLLPLGPLLASLGLALLGLSPSYFWLLLFVSVSGLGHACFHPESFKTIHLSSGKKKATAISFFLVGGQLGVSVGPLMVTNLYSHYGFKGSLGLLLPGILMATLLWATTFQKEPKSSFHHPSAAPRGTGAFLHNLFPVSLILLVAATRQAVRLSLVTFIPFFVINTLNRDPLVAGKYLSAFLFAGTVGSLVGGPLADRFGYKPFVLFSLGLAPVCLFLFFLTNGTLSFIFLVAAGFVLISSNAVTMAMGQSFMPKNLGMASGLILGFAMGMGGIGTTILGWVADRWGILSALHITSLLPLLGFLILFFLPYPPAKQETSGSPTCTP